MWDAEGRLFFPSQCCCSEHCGIGVHEVADEEFCLASEDGQHALVISCLYGSHDEVARLAEAAEEDEGFGGREGGEVGACFAEHLACELEDFVGYLVAFAGCDGYVERLDLVGWLLSQERGAVGVGEDFAGCACHACG